MSSARKSQSSLHHRKPELETSGSTPRYRLDGLPTELLDEIATQLPDISSLAALQATSTRLSEYVRLRGSKTYVKAHYPHFKDAVKFPSAREILDLEKLEQAWQRKSFSCRRIRPLDHQDTRASASRHGFATAANPHVLNNAYTPRILCFEDISDDRNSRTETLGVAAGYDLLFTKTVRKRSQGDIDREWRARKAVQGLNSARADILAFEKIGEELPGYGTTKILFSHTGTSDIVLIDPNSPEKTLATFGVGPDVESRSILVPPRRSDYFVCHGDEGITSVYRTDLDNLRSPGKPHFDVQPIAKYRNSSFNQAPSHVIQTATFINPATFVLADGEQSGDFMTYSISESGMERFTVRPSEKQFSGTVSGAVSTFKRIEQAHNPDQVFLAGRASGLITLHDLRTQSTSQVFRCGVDPNASIYCLLETTGSRILAGAGRNQNIKIFDLRKTGKVWDTISTQHPESEPYALYPKPPGTGDNSGSVYSFASSSISSPTIYIGLKGRILQLDITDLRRNKSDWRCHLDCRTDPVSPSFVSSFYPSDVSEPCAICTQNEPWNLSIAYGPNERGLGMRLKKLGTSPSSNGNRLFGSFNGGNYWRSNVRERW